MIAIITAFHHRLGQSYLARRFLRGASWSLIGSILAQGITMVTMLFVARLLGKETYGQFVLIQSTLTMFGIFAGFGAGATATRYIAAFRTNDKARLGHILALTERMVLLFGLIISIAIALFSRQLSTSVLNTSLLTMPLAIAAVTVLFATLDGYQKSVLVGFESMSVYAIGSVAGVVAGMPILLVAAGYFGIDGVPYALAVNALLQASISRILASRELRKNGIQLNARGCMKEWLVIRDFALPALLAGAMVTPAHWICQAMLANTNNGLMEVAELGVAMQWFNAVLFLPLVAGKIITPMLTEYVTTGNHDSSKRVLIISIAANFLTSLSVAMTISFISPWIISAYGPEFEKDSRTLIIAVFTATLVAAMAPLGSFLEAQAKMWIGLALNLAWFVSYISFGIIALNYGAIGIVSSMGIAYIFHAMWGGLLVAKIFQKNMT